MDEALRRELKLLLWTGSYGKRHGAGMGSRGRGVFGPPCAGMGPGADGGGG